MKLDVKTIKKTLELYSSLKINDCFLFIKNNKGCIEGVTNNISIKRFIDVDDSDSNQLICINVNEWLKVLKKVKKKNINFNLTANKNKITISIKDLDICETVSISKSQIPKHVRILNEYEGNDDILEFLSLSTKTALDNKYGLGNIVVSKNNLIWTSIDSQIIFKWNTKNEDFIKGNITFSQAIILNKAISVLPPLSSKFITGNKMFGVKNNEWEINVILNESSLYPELNLKNYKDVAVFENISECINYFKIHNINFTETQNAKFRNKTKAPVITFPLEMKENDKSYAFCNKKIKMIFVKPQ